MDEMPADETRDTRAATAPPEPSSRRWIAEAVLILVSVALGFAASEFGQYRQERGLARAVLRSITEEVKQNEAMLGAAVVKHREWQQALTRADVSAADTTAFRALMSSRPDGAGSIVVPLNSAAWQMAVSSGALRLLDFEVGQAVSAIYTVQTMMTEHHNRIVANALYTPGAYDPAARMVAARLLSVAMSELAGNEEGLLKLYHDHLPLLQREAGTQ